MNAKIKWYNKKTPHNHTIYTSHCGRYTIRSARGMYQIFIKGNKVADHHVRFSIGSAKTFVQVHANK